MAAPEVHHLFHNPIADHSFSADHKTLAIARDTSVELYDRVGNAFKLQDELKGHEKTVTSVDIAPNSGRIVSCSQGMLMSAMYAASRGSFWLTAVEIATPWSGSPRLLATSPRSCF
jgi:WD40 repeat protein